MKRFIKENCILPLIFSLLCLLLIFWGRTVTKELRDNAYVQKLVTLDARLSCLNRFGWEVDETSEVNREIFIPEPLDDNFRKYNMLQTPCGFNLEAYQGKKATCYTYLATNFPYPVSQPVYINLLILEGMLIAGDCTSEAIDGFILPLDRRLLP